MNPPQSVLSPGPSIQGHIIYHCAETRTIIIDGGILNLSHTDYRLLMLLLQHSESALPFVSFIELKQCFKDSQVNLRRSLSRRINILRERLWSYGLDIVNLRGQGYTLLLQPLQISLANPEGDHWHLSVSPTLLRSYPAGQVRRKEEGPHSTPLHSRPYNDTEGLRQQYPLHMQSASVLPERDDSPNIVSEGQGGGPPEESMAS